MTRFLLIAAATFLTLTLARRVYQYLDESRAVAECAPAADVATCLQYRSGWSWHDAQVAAFEQRVAAESGR